MASGHRRSVGVVMLSGGALLALVGIIGLLAGNDADPTSTATQAVTATAPAVSAATTTPTPTAAPTAGATATPDPTPTPEPSPTQEPEAVETFLSEILGPAMRSGDTDTLLGRLHPEAVTVFGQDACQRYLASVADPTFELTIREIAEPAPWTWVVDGLAVPIGEAVAVEVSRLINNQTIIQEMHIARVGELWNWFTVCGDPLEEAS